ncbi:transcription termination/antitermination protein NusG [Bacteroidia bacterium]|nr:transcription termination/antitermination protein NusG [Bacteroidia bacterium]GHT41710.1 transcription termination/antitermination protein NusG [Bacteroidia bacterium]
MAEIEKKFYVLKAVSGKENKIKEYLEAEIKNRNLQHRITQVVIPTEKVMQNRNGKKTIKERAFLPGYIIVEAALDGEVSHFLKDINFIIGFLEDGKEPMPLRASEVARILGKADELLEQPEELEVDFMIGETVKINVGPFTGFHGEIEEVYPDKKKVKVMVKIFGRKSPLELGYLQVEKE